MFKKFFANSYHIELRDQEVKEKKALDRWETTDFQMSDKFMRQILQSRDQREEVLENTFGNLKVSQPDSKGDLETHQLSQRTGKILKPAQSPAEWKSIPGRCRLLGTSTSPKIKVVCVFQRESFEDGLNCKPGSGRFKGIWENICTIEERFKLFCSYESSWLM